MKIKTGKIITLLLVFSVILGLSGCAKVKNYLWPEPTKAKPPAATADVTIIPSWSIIQVAEALEEKNICSKESFLEAAKVVPPGYDALVDGLGDADGYLFAAEGFIMPDTYNLYQNRDGKYALSVLLNYSQNTLNKLSYENQTAFARAEEMNMSMYEIYTLASVIMYEANLGASENDFQTMRQVSSVFHNRLANSNNGYKYIGSDATRKYIEKKMKNYITENGLNYDKYFKNYCTNNEYDLKTPGLPAGPVGAPSANAIKAALWPADTDYFYFFTDKDNNFHFYTNLKDFQNEWETKYKH